MNEKTRYTIAFTKEERIELRKKAAELNCSVSCFIKLCIEKYLVSVALVHKNGSKD